MLDSQLPEIDTTNLQTWGKTFAARVIAYANVRKSGEDVMLGDITNHPIFKEPMLNRGPYQVPDFICDNYIGNLPWNYPDSKEVLQAAMNVSGYLLAYEYLCQHKEFVGWQAEVRAKQAGNPWVVDPIKQIEQLEATPVYGNHFDDSSAFKLADQILHSEAPMEIKFRALAHIDKLTGEEGEKPINEEAVAKYIEATKES